MKSAIYAGSFDPIHNGHIDIIKRSAKIADKLYVAVLNNSHKKYLLSLEERMSLAEKTLSDVKNIEIITFDGLLLDFVEKNKITTIVKGVRNVQDFLYEQDLANGIKAINPDIETVLLFTTPIYSFLSSSMVKDVAIYSEKIENLVPKEVSYMINKKMGR